MTSPIRPVRIPSIDFGGVNATESSTRATPGETETGAGNSFAQAVGDALSQVNQLDTAVDELARRAAVGDLDSVSDFMVAATEAQLTTEITVAVRDRAISAFNDIMRMQL
ncbi:MAG: flagellar hook-basal body complex protein FliE [Actinomycetota bacterium]